MRSFAKDSLSGFSKRRIWLFLHLLHVLMLSQTSSMPTSNPTDPSVLQFEQPPQPDLHIINPIPISDPTPTPVLVSDVLMDTIFDGGPDQPCTGAECAGGAGGAQRKPHQQKGGSQTSQRAGSAHTSATGTSAGSPISKPSSSAIPVDVNDAVKKYVAGKSLSLPDVHHVIVDQTSLPADVAGSPPVAVSSPVPPAPPSNSDAKSPAVPHPPSPGQQGPAGPRHPQHKPPQPTPAPDAHLFAQPIAAVVDVAQQPARPIGVQQPRGNLALVPVPSPHHPMPRLPGHQHVLTQQQPILPGIAQSVPVNNILHQPTLPRVPVQDAEAGEQAEAPDPGELMCGAVEYEVGEELCCNGTVRQVQEGAAHLARCCGRAAYDTRTQTCCEYPVSSTSPQRRVLTKVITTAMETCCSSTPAQVQQQVLLCCGHLSYDPRSSMCCNGHVLQGSPQNGHRCCGAEKYIQGVEACCGNAVVYDPRVGTCCGSKITSTRSNSQLSCCGNQPFQPRSGSLCCSGILYHNNGQNPSRVACCGRAKYDRLSQLCCPGGRVVQGTNQQQCSSVAPTLNGAGQQRLQQHLQPAHPALPRPQYPYQTGALPGAQYRSRTLPASSYHYTGNQMGRGNLPLANTMTDSSRADYGPDAGYVPSSVSMIGNHPASYNQYITNQVRNHHAAATGTGYAQGHHRSVNSPPGDNTAQQSRKTAATDGKPRQWQDQADIFLNSMSGGATHTSNGTASP
ncbi:uncharacterized protein LOC135812174 [Sycon ciliatum]|uniref:uncharacterized protein LOC135812174 n=1 Tax=Sycon ciliatum TaxID=27933 RepID=UPI0031F6A98D